MPFVIYTSPNYTENAVRFIRTLTRLGDVRLGLISQEPRDWLPADIKVKLTDFQQVEDLYNFQQVEAAAKLLAGRQGKIHRIFGAVEQAQIPVAQVRESLGIEGMDVETAHNFRDKSRMKNLLRAAGLPCARHQMVTDKASAFAFAEVVGYPLVVKPPDGAASQSTYKANHTEDLEKALSLIPPKPSRPVLLEEFITGDEFSFDTFSLDGKSAFYSLTHYFPNPLEAMREPWIQWQVLLPREVEDPFYDDIKAAAFKTLDVLGMKTGMSHLEWFRRKDGSIAVSEVAARPPGAQITTLISRANDFDSVAAWARMMIFGEFPTVERKYAVGAAYLRGQGTGKVQEVLGLEQVQREVGHLICDAQIPKKGQEKSLSYEGEGYVILRHPETAVVKEALSRVVSTVRVILG
ncbi:MAG: ATP-grasp domain-containing protein [Saprospiraceae bacterium]|nr:ATP-grasp domain-containing protein [Saprospiraceae bacterium]MCF8252559.1 ATP-grasp domain-containing protein [Saprospiraceae bacterium]MCF8282600.1 ATP-grasp domain-containing protein [Bacteroidales bacterium]MCF8314153.1 ATP-grasp domain-containing protein [Saprospiraceae bacterium]MCF8442911.1 ATP-grasp domain-containing protein [Saprospiraceae bacterium]